MEEASRCSDTISTVAVPGSGMGWERGAAGVSGARVGFAAYGRLHRQLVCVLEGQIVSRPSQQQARAAAAAEAAAAAAAHRAGPAGRPAAPAAPGCAPPAAGVVCKRARKSADVPGTTALAGAYTCQSACPAGQRLPLHANKPNQQAVKVTIASRALALESCKPDIEYSIQHQRANHSQFPLRSWRTSRCGARRQGPAPPEKAPPARSRQSPAAKPSKGDTREV